MAFALRDLAALLLRHQEQRRRWQGDQRLHVQAWAPPSGSAAEQDFAEAVQAAFSGQSGVEWARWNAASRRVVIAGPAVSDPEPLIRRLAELEQQLGTALRSARLEEEGGLEATGEPAASHPADADPILRSLAEIVADLAGAGVGLGLQATPSGRRLGIDLAAALRVLESLPAARQRIDRQLGPGTAELILKLADALDYALLRGIAGPLVGLVEQALRLRSRLQHRHRWQRLEERLHSRPEDHPAVLPEPGPRPSPLRAGVIERYRDRAAVLSLAGFGLGLATLGTLEGSAAALLAGLPRPALLGRSGFCLELGWRLEQLGALVLVPEALERLDRIDTVVIDGPLLEGPWGSALLAAASQAGLQVVAARDDAAPGPPGQQVERVIPRGEASIPALHRLQRGGHGVMVLAGADLPALAAADLGLGIAAEQQPPPWSAHVIAPAGLEPAWLLLPATAAARRCAEQGVQASLLDAVVGLALCLDGLTVPTTLGVNQATNVLALVAMANGLRLARSLEPAAPLPAAETVVWHALPAEEVLQRLGTEAEGLPDPNPPGAAGRLGAASARRSLGQLLLDELDNPLSPVLATGAVLSGVVGEVADAGLILGVLGINALIGASQRQRVEASLAALQQREAAPTWVKRGGQVVRLQTDHLVVGDVVLLSVGEVVPADCRLLSATGLQVDEAVLTGESFPVGKAVEPAAAEAALADRSSMLYQGTTVVAGEATAVVVATGDGTEARRGLAAARGAGRARGVEARLESLTATTTPVAGLGGLSLLLAALVRQQDPRRALSEAVALAVAAVPEGLPILASLAQSSAAGRLARDGVLVRNPRAIESLGRVTVICLDKTGTLTSGRIQLIRVDDGQRPSPLAQLDASGQRVLRHALRATPVPEPGTQLPHPTDRGLREGASQAQVDAGNWQLRQSLPFEPARGFHASLGCRQDGQGWQLCVKGAPEVVLAACCQEPSPLGPVPLGEESRERLELKARQLAEQGLRVLAVAQRRLEAEIPLEDAAVCELEFVGFVALADPIRPTARQALLELQQAGITAKIITGDHPATAAAIARELELPNDGTVLTGPMIDALDDGALQQAVQRASVFARVSSLQKLRLVRVLRQAGAVVAMTGDGANDAPAIRLAEVGIALGERATEAARLAADIVVTDGRMETIGRAVLEGRALWRSVRDAVALLVGGNLGEIGFTVLTAVGEGRSALNTRQLLLLNLLTDVAPALTIAMRPPVGLDPQQLLQEGPEASLGANLNREIVRKGLITALTASLARGLAQGRSTPAAADSVGLVALVATQLAQMGSSGSVDRVTLLTALASLGGLVGVVQTPGLSQGFGCEPLETGALLQAGAIALLGAAVSHAHQGPASGSDPQPKVSALPRPTLPASSQPSARPGAS